MNRPNKSRGPRATITGILVLDKPVGLSSMEAATACRTRAGGAKVGHAGTLDPLATGVLVAKKTHAHAGVAPGMRASRSRTGDIAPGRRYGN